MLAFLSKLKRRFSRDLPKREVRFDAEGFSVFVEEEKKGSVRWSDVVEVFAYKVDLFSVDQICIGFRVESAGTYWWVGEDDVGYREFLEELSRRFPGIRADWFTEVAHPAFAENRTTIWGEPWAAPKEAPNQTPEPTAPSGRGSS
jgi:hypothetical protein